MCITILMNILMFIALIARTHAYPTCSTVDMGQYYFDLSSLSSIGTSLIQMGSATIAISPCATDTCNGVSCFMKKKIGSTCQPYTLNEVVLHSFHYINQDSPSTGIQIDYLPYVSTSKSTANISNQTINTTTTITYLGTLLLYCNSASSKAASCVEETGLNSTTTTDSKNNTITTSYSMLTCSYWHSSGCPALVVNQFNAFIAKNLIWLSIIIWIIALFQLLLGYFVIRLTIFVFGVASGVIFGLIYNSLGYVDYVSSDNGLEISIFILVLSILMGVLFGISLLTLPKLGYVNIGLWVALIFSLLLQNSVLYMTGSLLGFYIALGVSALIMIVLSLLALRNFIILSTTFISAFGLVRPLGFFLPYYPNELTTAKNYLISSASGSTQWQFYLYLISIAVITILGAAFQFCLYKKKGRDHGNKGYYLEEDGTIRDKMKRLLEFKDVRDFLKAGKDQVMFLKNLVVDDQSQSEQKPQPRRPQKTQKSIEMQNINASATKSRLQRQSQQQSPQKQKKPISSSKKSIQQKRPAPAPTSKDKGRRPPSASEEQPSQQESQEQAKVVKKVVKTNRKK